MCEEEKEKKENEYVHLLKRFGKWLVISIVLGIFVGIVGALFHISLDFATKTRQQNTFIIYFLPIAGLIIVFLYKIMGMENDKGTNAVLNEAKGEDAVSWKTVILIFVSTFLTHLCGGSAGREGAALQIGGGIAKPVGKLFKLTDGDTAIIAICGMAAGFSSLFGTPAAAAVFALEVSFAGIINLAAVFPCIVSSVIASETASLIGVKPTSFTVADVPAFGGTECLPTLLKVFVIGILCAYVAMLFCKSIGLAGGLYKKYIKNPYLRVLAGAAIVIVLTLIVGNNDYNGAGTDVIEKAFAGEAFPAAFLLKIIFTALTLGAGFKGGEIVPTFFTGATFGCFAASLLGLSPSFGAAIGLLGAFCGVTNCPLATFILGMELFGANGAVYYILVIAVSYILSGYIGLYSAQGFFMSKSEISPKDSFKLYSGKE